MSRLPSALKMSTLEVPSVNLTPSPLSSGHLSASTASLAVTESSKGEGYMGDPSLSRGRSQTASSAQTLPSLDMSNRTGSSDTVDSPSGAYQLSATPSSVSSLANIPEADAEEEEPEQEDHASPSAERGRQRQVKTLGESRSKDEDVPASRDDSSSMRPLHVLDQIFMGPRRPHTRQRSTEVRRPAPSRPQVPPEFYHLPPARPTLAHKGSLSSLALTETTIRPRALSRCSLADSDQFAVLSGRAQSAHPGTRNRDSSVDTHGEDRRDATHGRSDSGSGLARFEYYQKLHDALASPDWHGSISRWRVGVDPAVAEGSSSRRVTRPLSRIPQLTRPRRRTNRVAKSQVDLERSVSPAPLLPTSSHSFITPKRRSVPHDDDYSIPPESPLDQLSDLLSSLPRAGPFASYWFSLESPIEGSSRQPLTSLVARDKVQEATAIETPITVQVPAKLADSEDAAMDVDSPLKGKAQTTGHLGSSGIDLGSSGIDLGTRVVPIPTAQRSEADSMNVDLPPQSLLAKRIIRPSFLRIHTHPSGRAKHGAKENGLEAKLASARSGASLSDGRPFSDLSTPPCTTSTPIRPTTSTAPLRLFKRQPPPPPTNVNPYFTPSGPLEAGPSRRGSLLRPGAFVTPVRQIATPLQPSDQDLQTPSPLGQKLLRTKIKSQLHPVTPIAPDLIQTPERPADIFARPDSPVIDTRVISDGLPVKSSSTAVSTQKAPPEAPKKAAPRRHTTLSLKTAPLKLHRRTPSENPFVSALKGTKGLKPLANRDANRDDDTSGHVQFEPGGDPHDYQVSATLGSGSFGEVTKVIKTSTGKVLAKKCIRGNTSSPSKRREEVAVLRYLSKRPHRGIVAYIASWETRTSLSECHIVTSFCPRGTLKSHLLKVADQGGMGEAGAWCILNELSSAIEHIHKLRICHHDIKPDNVLIAADFSLVLADFGVASGVNSDGLLSNIAPQLPAVLPCGWHSWPQGCDLEDDFMPIAEHEERSGDKTYMPREGCLGGNGVGLPVDIFALGMVILEVACNVILPIEGNEWHQLRSDDFGILKPNFHPRRKATDPPFDQTYTPPLPALTADLLNLLFDQMLASDTRRRSSITTIRDHPILQHLARRPYSLALTDDDGWFIAYLRDEWRYSGDCSLRRDTVDGLETPSRLGPKVAMVENTFLNAPARPKIEDANPFLTISAAKVSQDVQSRQSRAMTCEHPGLPRTTKGEGSSGIVSGSIGSKIPRWKVPSVQRTWKKGYQ